jgi:hypothetical protein
MSISVATAGAPPVDILVTDADMRPIVIVEVKNQEDLSREDAIRLFRDLTSYAVLPAAPFVLIVSQEYGYLWKDPPLTGEIPPPLEFPLDVVVRRYFPASSPPRRLRSQEVQIAVARWLLQLAYHGEDVQSSPERLLRDIGFIAAVDNAIVIPDPYT